MLTDFINDGFGATPPAALDGTSAVAPGMMCRIISTQPNQRADILTINAASVQSAGAPVATKFIAIFALRAPSFQAAANGQPVIPLRPAGGFGLPGNGEIPAGAELLYAGYLSVANQGVPLEFERGELTASNGQRLAVLAAPVIDGTTNPPAYRASDPVTLTVLGTLESLVHSDGHSVAGGDARSLPRYDV